MKSVEEEKIKSRRKKRGKFPNKHILASLWRHFEAKQPPTPHVFLCTGRIINSTTGKCQPGAAYLLLLFFILTPKYQNRCPSGRGVGLNPREFSFFFRLAFAFHPLASLSFPRRSTWGSGSDFLDVWLFFKCPG